MEKFQIIFVRVLDTFGTTLARAHETKRLWQNADAISEYRTSMFGLYICSYVMVYDGGNGGKNAKHL